VANDCRLTSPSRSRLWSVSVRTRGEIPSIARFSSPNRKVPPSRKDDQKASLIAHPVEHASRRARIWAAAGCFLTGVVTRAGFMLGPSEKLPAIMRNNAAVPRGPDLSPTAAGGRRPLLRPHATRTPTPFRWATARQWFGRGRSPDSSPRSEAQPKTANRSGERSSGRRA